MMTTEELIQSGKAELFVKYHESSMNLYALVSVLCFYDGKVVEATIKELRVNGASDYIIECFNRVLEDCKTYCHIE